jgi:tetratricopeptide (TPR) repeat protein
VIVKPIHTFTYAMFLGLLAAIGLGNLADHHFAYDDLDYLRNAVQAQRDFWYIFSADKPWSGRPTCDLVFYWVYPYFGESPGTYHLLNVGFHTLAAFLLAVLARQITSNIKIASLAGILFLLNVIHIRGISWIASIGYPLGACFFLVSLILFWSAIERFVWWKLLFASLSFLFALGSHPGFIPTVFIFPLMLYIKKNSNISKYLFPIGGVTVFFAAVLKFYYVSQVETNGNNYVWDTRLIQNGILFTYNLFWNAHIIFVNPIQVSDVNMVLGTITIIIVGFFYRKTDWSVRFWVVLGVLATILFLPFSPVPIGESHHFSRYLYISSIATSVLLAQFFIYLYRFVSHRNHQHMFTIIGLFILIVSSVYWLRRLECLEYAYSGDYYLSIGQSEQAQIGFRQAILAYPEFSPKNYIKLGKTPSSDLSLLEQGVHLFSDNARLAMALGLSNWSLGGWGDAKPHIQRAFALDPSDSNLYYVLSLFLINSNMPKQAIDILQRGLSVAPDNIGLEYRLGDAFLQTNDLEHSLNIYLKLLKKDSSNAILLTKIGVVCQKQGRLQEAESYFETALAVHLQEINNNLHGGEDQIRYIGLPVSANFVPLLYQTLGDIATERGELNRARSFFLQGVEEAKKRDLTGLIKELRKKAK